MNYGASDDCKAQIQFKCPVSDSDKADQGKCFLAPSTCSTLYPVPGTNRLGVLPCPHQQGAI